MAIVQTAKQGVYIAMSGQVFEASHLRKKQEENRLAAI
jgi:hypothetical protein